MTHQVIIIGGGPAGLTAALYTARAMLEPILLSGPLSGGQLMTTTDVENFPGFSEGIMGPDLMEQMMKQAERFGTKTLNLNAEKIEVLDNALQVYLSNGELLETKSIIISTGATAKTLGLEKDKELMGFGLSTCATCDGAFYKDEEVLVVGGGDSACEEALFLTRFAKRVRLIHRRDELRASKIMADRVLAEEKIEVLWNTELLDLLGEKTAGGVKGAKIFNNKTNKESDIECSGIFYAIGHKPNTEIFKGVLEMDSDNYLVTAPDSTKTNIEGVFASGDVQDKIYRQAITAAGSGCMAALEAEKYLMELE